MTHDKSEVIHQTTLAFDFIQKLYLEVSYLIKEIEGILPISFGIIIAGARPQN